MSGVESGTRLERLRRVRRATHLQAGLAARNQRWVLHADLILLLDNLDAAIAEEEAVLPAAAPVSRPGLTATDSTVRARLDELGVTTHDVKVWAVAQGLLPAVVRGRVAAHLVDAYEHAHRTQEPA